MQSNDRHRRLRMPRVLQDSEGRIHRGDSEDEWVALTSLKMTNQRQYKSFAEVNGRLMYAYP